MKRTFIAFNIIPAAETKSAIEVVRHKLRLEKINWVPDENFHMTLKFLGNTELSLLPEITLKIKKALSGFSPFGVMLHGIGVFKQLSDPRVIWMGCEVSMELNDMKHAIEHALSEFGFEEESRPFNPHLTIGRIHQMRQINQLTEVVALFRNTTFQKDEIREIIFYESQLLPEGARYTPLQIFKL
jgi:2'-5' RNA ligase